MNPAQLRRSLVIVGLLAIGLRVARLIVPGEFPESVAFAVAAVSLFRFGFPLQIHAVESLKRFRVTPRTAIWFVTAVAFWYSTIIWVWWSRRSLSFPLFLLDSRLQTRLFFDAVPVLVLAGLAIDLRVQNREQRSDPGRIV